MDGWTIGLIAVVVLGLAAILTGALLDRARNRRAREQVMSPPDRSIPRFSPDRPAPRYLSELQARRAPTNGADEGLSTADRRRLEEQLGRASAVRIDATLVSADFVTDVAGGRAVLDDPLVLLCADRIGSVREILPAMERAALTRRPLVVVAPGVSPEVRATTEVNVIQRKLQLAVVEAGDHARAQIGELTAATLTSSIDRQAGYLPSEAYGTAPRWVSSLTETAIVTGRATSPEANR